MQDVSDMITGDDDIFSRPDSRGPDYFSETSSPKNKPQHLHTSIRYTPNKQDLYYSEGVINLFDFEVDSFSSQSSSPNSFYEEIPSSIESNFVTLFENWIRDNLFISQEYTIKKYLMQSLGILLGALSSSMMYELAADLPHLLEQGLTIEDAPKSVLGNLLGILAVLPTAAIAATAAYDSFKKIATKKPDRLSDIYHPKLINLYKMMPWVTYFLSVFSIIPLGALAWQSCSNPAKYFLTSSAIIAPIFFNKDALDKSILRMFAYINRGESLNAKEARLSLQTMLQRAEQAVVVLEHDEVEVYYQRIFLSQKRMNSAYKEMIPLVAVNEFQAESVSILNQIEKLSDRAPSSTSVRQENILAADIIAILGGIIGVLSSCVFFIITEAFIESIFDHFSTTSNTMVRDFVKYPIATLSFIPAALNEWRVREVFLAVYNYLFNTTNGVENASQSNIFSFTAIMAMSFLSMLPFFSVQLKNTLTASDMAHTDPSFVNVLTAVFNYLVLMSVFLSYFLVNTQDLKKISERCVDSGSILLSKLGLLPAVDITQNYRRQLTDLISEVSQEVTYLSDKTIESIHQKRERLAC